MATKIEGSRLLRKLIPGTSFTMAVDESFDFSAGEQASGWTVVVNDINQPFAVWRGYFDLAGLAMQDLTMMVAVPGWQECDGWDLTYPGGVRPLIRTWDILSKAAIPDEALDADRWVSTSIVTGWKAPGQIGSEYNLEEIFSGRYRQFAPNTSWSGGQALAQTTQQEWGAGDATAGDKIYITRVIVLHDTQVYPDGLLVVPPMSVIIPIALLDEPDLQHMERLRRSYVEKESRP